MMIFIVTTKDSFTMEEEVSICSFHQNIIQNTFTCAMSFVVAQLICKQKSCKIVQKLSLPGQFLFESGSLPVLSSLLPVL